jgi:hypothetical protein
MGDSITHLSPNSPAYLSDVHSREPVIEERASCTLRVHEGMHAPGISIEYGPENA